MTKTMTLLFAFLFAYIGLQAAPIKGFVYDQKTGEPIEGAIITIRPGDKMAVSGLDGSFELKNAPVGKATLEIAHVNYAKIDYAITVKETDNSILRIYLGESGTQKLGEVVITSRNDGASEKTARKLEQKSIQTMNVVSGAAIEKSPDLTVANVIQRVSGVSVERSSNGEGQYAILRGMDKRYNYTLINDVKIPSPDNKYRYVPLDIFPAELLDRLEVYKSLTPNMEGDAIGGAVNMVMKDAPKSFHINANVATGYSQMLLDRKYLGFPSDNMNAKSPYELNGRDYKATSNDFALDNLNYKPKSFTPNTVAGLSIGQRFLDGKLGVIVAGSFQNNFRGTNSEFNNIANVDTMRYAVITSMQQRQYSEQQRRTGVHAKIDYKLNENHKFYFYNAYMDLYSLQTRNGIVTNFSNADYDPKAGNAQLSYVFRSRKTNQQIYTANLHGDHKFLDEKLKIQWSGVLSTARNEVPEYTDLTLNGVRKNFVEQQTTIVNSNRRWERNTDNDYSGYLDVTYKVKWNHTKVDFSAGGLYRDKQRSNFFNNYVLRSSDINALYGKDFTAYGDIKWDVQNPQGSVANALTYDAYEKTSAGYGMVKVDAKKLEVIAGVRVEHTNQGYQMFFPFGETRPDGRQVYTDVLPSLNVKYELSKQQNLKASYFRSLNRPGFFEIVPGTIVQEDYRERGNPDLKRALADNVDLRYELFPNAGEQLLVGAFYKRIQNPIEFTIQPDPTRPQDVYYTPGNFGTARNYGLELDYIKFFNKIGIKANYTYTHSRITTPKSLRVRDASTNGDLKTILVDQTRPLYGQSEHIGNLSVLYKDVRTGWDAQLAAAYTGSRINTVSQFVDNDFWQKGFVQMDFSLEKRIGQHLSLFTKLGNLLNTPSTIFIKGHNDVNNGLPGQSSNKETLIRKEYYKQTYLLGVRVKL